MSKKSVGVYISQKSVDIIEITGSKKSPVLLNFVRQDIKPGPAQDNAETAEGKPEAKDNVTAAMEEGFKKLGSKPQSVQAVLASSDVMIRYFEMPALPKSEQHQAIKFEAKKYIPFKISDITSDYKVFVSASNKKNMDVFFIAATNNQINSCMSKFKSVETVVSGIDIMPFSLWRIAILSRKVEAKDTAAIFYIDNDKESASIHIMEKGAPFMSRELKLNNDDKDAAFEKAASELRVSLDYYKRQRPDSELAKIIICGEDFLPGMDSYITDELKIVTESLYDFDKAKEAKKLPPSAIVAFGCALEGLGRSNYSVNLSPLSSVIKQKKTYNIIAIESIAAAALIIAVYLLNSFMTSNIAKALRGVKRKAKACPSITANLSLEALEARKEKVLKNIDFLRFMLENRISWSANLSRIADGLSVKSAKEMEGIWINKLIIEDKFVKSDTSYPNEINRDLFMSGSSFAVESDKEISYIDSFFNSLKNDEIFMRPFNSIDLGAVKKNDIEGYQVCTFSVMASSSDEPQLTYGDRQVSLGRRTGRR